MKLLRCFARVITFVLCFGMILGGCSSSGEVVSSTDSDDISSADDVTNDSSVESNILFSDDFEGTELDLTKWQRCPEWFRQGKSFWKNELSYLDGEGHLVLEMKWNEETGLVDCGAVRTLGTFTAGYAYYEASIKFPVAEGTWGAFWMMAGNVSSEKNGALDGVEIDIIESIHNEQGKYNHALHWDGYYEAHKSLSPKLMLDINIYDGEFHTFGLLRSEEYYIFYIDGQISSIVSKFDGCDPCPEDGYMKLTCEAAEWAGAGTEASINSLPTKMLVDYVRVYKEKP